MIFLASMLVVAFLVGVIFTVGLILSGYLRVYFLSGQMLASFQPGESFRLADEGSSSQIWIVLSCDDEVYRLRAKGNDDVYIPSEVLGAQPGDSFRLAEDGATGKAWSVISQDKGVDRLRTEGSDLYVPVAILKTHPYLRRC